MIATRRGEKKTYKMQKTQRATNIWGKQEHHKNQQKMYLMLGVGGEISPG